MRIPAILIAAVTLTGAAFAVENWPQYRGPHEDGHADATGLPVTWSEKENIVWKTAIHDKGWSSPVVWGDQIWMTTAKADGTQMFAVCVDRKTGEVTHDLKLFDVATPDPLNNQTNSYASPTPTIEEGRVYVHFGSYGTACLDTKTGAKLWERRDLRCNHWRGPASSPILYGDLLILTFDGYDAQYVIALNKKTGQTVWRSDRERDFDYGTDDGDRRKAFGTPSVITIKGKPELISPAAIATTAFDPLTGKVLWTVHHGGMNVTQPPLFAFDKVILCTGDGGLKMLAVRPEGAGDLPQSNIEWKYSKNVPSRSSPTLVNGLLFFANEGGMLSCIDAKNGDPVWQERLGGSFWASPIYADGRLYLFDNEGTTTVGAVGRTWNKLATNKLDDGCMASPAVAGKSLFVRTKTHLYRIEKKD
jgi:outer membrane protein assembly factor BamB